MKLSKRSFALASAITASIFYTLSVIAFRLMLRFELISSSNIIHRVSKFPAKSVLKALKFEQIDMMSPKFMIFNYLINFTAIFITALVAGFVFAAFYNRTRKAQ